MADETSGKGNTPVTDVRALLQEDISGVQGTGPNDAQDAAIALGTEPRTHPAPPFTGGGEIDWAGLGQDIGSGNANQAAEGKSDERNENRFRDVDDDTLLDMFEHAHEVGDEHCDGIGAELRWRGIEVPPCTHEGAK